MVQRYPADPNLMLWLASTTSHPGEVESLINRTAQLCPNHPGLAPAHARLVEMCRYLPQPVQTRPVPPTQLAPAYHHSPAPVVEQPYRFTNSLPAIPEQGFNSGNLLGTFDKTPQAGFKQAGLSLLMALIGCITLIGAIILLDHLGAVPRFFIVLPIMAIGYGLYGTVANSLRALLGKKESLVVYENGFRVERNGTQFFYSWDQLLKYTHFVNKIELYGVTFGTVRKLTLATVDGMTWTVTQHFWGSETAAELLPMVTSPVLVQRGVKLLNAGQSLSFGSLSLTPMGLATPHQMVPWSQVAQLATANGMLTIYYYNPASGKSQKLVSLSCANTPNIFALEELVRLGAPNLQS